MDPDQDRHFFGPDLGPNCLQMLSADDTSRQRVRPLYTYGVIHKVGYNEVKIVHFMLRGHSLQILNNFEFLSLKIIFVSKAKNADPDEML